MRRYGFGVLENFIEKFCCKGERDGDLRDIWGVGEVWFCLFIFIFKVEEIRVCFSVGTEWVREEGEKKDA